ncbi:MAG: hypothetical protein J5U17_05270 [Candidatus Methanoperedens sp.]|nr:hypothetical protein [Candidatus Methanoperedens sp.]MCE8429315.1 hypothetical protein [Candidatus Methanoperedens sp.]
MRKTIFLLFFLIACTQVSLAESIFTIEINQSGDALWTMEKHVTLTQPEMNEWENVIKAGQNITRYSDVPEFKELINQFNLSAMNFSNRSMEIKDVNISYDVVKTMSGGYGVIRYNFIWRNFSYNRAGKIIIDDAFSNETVISPEIMLIITIPEGYNAESVTPKNDRIDGNDLIWEGSLYRNFTKGEPALVLTRNALIKVEVNWLWIAVPVIVIIILAFFVWKWRFSKSDIETKAIEKIEDTDFKETNEDDISLPENDDDIQENMDENTGLPFDLSEEFLEDEDRIEKFLIKSGGQAFQSKIVDEMGVSKSKISIVLAKMKENGRIIKIRKGKENIIRLVINK